MISLSLHTYAPASLTSEQSKRTNKIEIASLDKMTDLTLKGCAHRPFEGQGRVCRF